MPIEQFTMTRTPQYAKRGNQDTLPVKRAKHPRQLKICQLNICGLSAHSRTALDRYASDEQLSIIALQETKLSSAQIDVIDSKHGYCDFFLPKEEETQGVGLLIMASLQPQRIPCLEESELDIIWCSVKIDKLDVLVASAYCPPRISVDGLKRLMKNISAAHDYSNKHKIKNVLVFGDYNSRNINWGDTMTNNRGRVLLNFVQNSEFTLYTPADKTFVCSNNGGSVIDLLLAQGKVVEKIQENWIDRDVELFTGAPSRGHYPILYSMHVTDQTKSKKIYQNYNSTDWKIWREKIECELEHLINEAHESVEDLKRLVHKFNMAMVLAGESIPKKIITCHSKPFWTPALTVLSKELKFLLVAARRRGTPQNNENLKAKKEEFRVALIQEKNDWIKEKLSNINVADSATFWKRYKRLFGQKESNFIGNLVAGGVMKTKDKEKEEILFETFFTGSHLDKNSFDESFKEKLSTEYERLKENDFKLTVASSSMIQKLFKEFGVRIELKDSIMNQVIDLLNEEVSDTEITAAILKQKSVGKCSDSYAVNPIMLKHLGVAAKTVLKSIFNLSLQTGYWGWKNSDVCFLKKDGKDSYLDPGSYRPISISSYVGKIFERILESRIRDHCQFCELLDDEQEGFCPNKSTTRYLFKLMASLSDAKAKKLTAMILLIDLQKAFDSVWIPGLIVKLYSFGITGNILRLLNDFLISRKLSLKVNQKIGELRNCSQIGLPQGSVLSPLLFIIYVTDMLSHIQTSRYGTTEALAFKFADDGTVSVTGKTMADCHNTMQLICNTLITWCNKWRLIINCSRNKTEVIQIQNEKSLNISDPTIPNIKVGLSELAYVDKSKVLGVIIDKDLSFNQHSRDVLRRCWYYWYKISKNTTRMYGLNTASLCLLYKTLVMTRMLYACPIWLGNHQQTFKELWSKMIIKISGSEYHTERDLTEVMLNMPPLSMQFNTVAVKFLLKCMTSDDRMITTILNLEHNNKHPMFNMIQQLKAYLIWKGRESDTVQQHRLTRQTHRSVELIEYMNHEYCHYSKGEIVEFVNFTWRQEVQSRHPEQPLGEWNPVIFKLLFPRGSTRECNTHISEFIHGHSLRFGNFRKSVRKSNTDDCQYCMVVADSVEHQLFECPIFECEERQLLLSELQQNISDFKWKIVTNGVSETPSTAIKIYSRLVKHVVKTAERYLTQQV